MPVPRVEVVVLGLLAEAPAHGYDLLERFRARSMGFWVEIGRASVYQALGRLERRGEIVGRDQDGRDGPDRRVFRITQAGRARLRAGVRELAGSLEPFDTDAGLALGFLRSVPSSEAKAALDARAQALNDLVAAIGDERARTVKVRGGERTVSDALLDRQQALADAELAWLASAGIELARARR